MKIYNKHNFSLGLFFCLLGIAMLTVNIRKGFDIKGSLILALCLFFGIGILIRSLSAGLSREDKISELDERNLLVKIKSRSTAFLWSEGICFLCLLACMLGAFCHRRSIIGTYDTCVWHHVSRHGAAGINYCDLL
ncbi:hypothetical protein DXB59_10395 [Ruminococcus sp. OM05-10BH]|nr:hypothetical protein DXB59_10395 [Ruminococcus sp. OM05-10BH]